jgi:membrane protein required for colicin V production
MNLVDILIWLILAGFVYKGFHRGLVRQICSLTGFLLGGWAAIRYHLYLADASRHLIHLPHYLATILSFLFIFLLTGLLFFLLGHILTVMFKMIMLGGLNRAGGLLLGFLEGAFIICMVLYFGTSKPAPEKLKGYIGRSATAAPFVETGREIVAGWGGLPDLIKVPAGVNGTKASGSTKVK